MKNLKVWLLALPFFTIACSYEESNETGLSAPESSLIQKSGPALPAYAANPYDVAGRAHNEILDTLDQLDIPSPTIELIGTLVDSLAAAHPELPASASISDKTAEITWLINSEAPLETAIASSPLGTAARSSLQAFITSLMLNKESPFEDIYAFITSYEDSVLANTSFTADEQRIILTTSSVSRYSFYRKRRKDKDWETSVGNIAATVSGAEDGNVVALKMAVVVGYWKNRPPAE